MLSYFKALKWTILQSLIFYGLYSLTASLLPLVAQQLFDHYDRGLAFLGQISLLTLSLVIINLGMEYGNRVWEWKISKELAILLRSDLFMAVISQNNQEFEQKKPVDYLSVITNQVDAVSEDYFSATIDLTKSLLKLLIFCISMTYVLNWQLTLVILIFSLVTSYLPNLTQRTLAKLRKTDLASQQTYNHQLLDLLSGYSYVTSQTIGVFGREHRQSLIDREDQHLIFGRFRVLSDMIYSFGTGLMYLTVLSLSGYFLISGQLSLGTASASLLYTSSLIGAISDVLSCVNVLHSAKEIVADIQNDLQQAVLEERQEEAYQAQKLVIDRLSFDRENFHLKADQVQFRRGERTALIGHSGAGKTTFFKLLNGELTSKEEKLYLDNRELTPDLKAQTIFTLRQGDHLFDSDLLTNLTFWGQFPLRVQVLDLLDRLPLTLQERLKNYQNLQDLSGGERQVISILRCLNMPQPILLMDEPFSQIDKETKAIISDFLSQQDNRIILEITHDRSQENLDKYPQILKLSEGRLTKKI